MEIVHSGFDSLYFSVQGALSAEAVRGFEILKSRALEQKASQSLKVHGCPVRYRIQENGKRGGYTFVIETGRLGTTISFKTDLSRDRHNAFVEISSAHLLALGWRAAVDQTLNHLKALGFHMVGIILNRVDYCIDFADAQIEINPREFIAHSRVKKRCRHESFEVSDHTIVSSVAQSDHVKSVTLGTMPGRQIIVYNKRAEVIEKSKTYWFDAWKIDRFDPTRTVHRVEVRAGKKHLLANNLRTLADFENHIGCVLTDAVEKIRWVKPSNNDSNVSRAPLQPIWETVQTHVKTALGPYSAPITEQIITDKMRQNKRLEYMQQAAGNLGGLMGCSGISYDDIPSELSAFVKDLSETLSDQDSSPITKSYLRAKDRWA